MPAFLRRFAALALCLIVLSACSGETNKPLIDRKGNVATDVDVEKLYNEAATSLDRRQYATAAKLFEEVERQYPYSTWATKAQLMSAYAHYRNVRYDEAVIALDRFISLHPGDKDIAYAYYLRALCYYEQISDVRRDQRMTELALDRLREVQQRFPDSEYGRDAKFKIDLTLDHLAGKEMDIGRYYQIRGHHHAAITRFTNVINNYQTTTQVPEALHRLVESYLALGLRSEAERNASVLGHNYPGSAWYEDSYELLTGEKVEGGQTKEPGILSRTIGRVIN